MKKRKKVVKSKLSFAAFADDGDGGEGGEDDAEGASWELGVTTRSSNHLFHLGPPAKRPKTRKNPTVDTSFLPDREREEQERKEREVLRQEWLTKQEDLKAEEVEVTYSYWDGSGHRKSVNVLLLMPAEREHGTQIVSNRSKRATKSVLSSRKLDNSFPNFVA